MFCSFLWNSDNLYLGEVRINFFSEICKFLHWNSMSIIEKASFIKPEVNERIGTLKPFSFAKHRDSETALYKNRDCETHITAKTRDGETRKIRLTFCETQSFLRTIHHPFINNLSESRILDLYPKRRASATFSYRSLRRVSNVSRLRPFYSRLQRVKLIIFER